jgi:hypothetical protein
MRELCSLFVGITGVINRLDLGAWRGGAQLEPLAVNRPFLSSSATWERPCS